MLKATQPEISFRRIAARCSAETMITTLFAWSSAHIVIQECSSRKTLGAAVREIRGNFAGVAICYYQNAYASFARFHSS